MKNLLWVILVWTISTSALCAEEIRASGPISVLTWNIQVGSDNPPFKNGWPERKLPLAMILKKHPADVICMQEAREEQLLFIDKQLSQFRRVGVGRDDGKSAGEFCPIYFNTNRLQVLKSGTFWLSATPDDSKNTWDNPYKRICTHALFKDKINETRFVVLSTHFPLNAPGQLKSANLIVNRIKSLYEGMPVLLCGDFNCEPGSAPWAVFEKNFLEPVDSKHLKTYHEKEKVVSCIDSIFKDEDITALAPQVIKDKYHNVYPSDHFGLIVKVSIPEINR